MQTYYITRRNAWNQIEFVSSQSSLTALRYVPLSGLSLALKFPSYEAALDCEWYIPTGDTTQQIQTLEQAQGPYVAERLRTPPWKQKLQMAELDAL